MKPDCHTLFLPGSRMYFPLKLPSWPLPRFLTTGLLFLSGAAIAACFSRSEIKASNSASDILLNTFFKQRGETIGKKSFQSKQRKKASILTDRSMKFESSCDLHTVLVCSQMNKTGALTSEPFMKGMFLVENFSRDLHKRFRQLITGKSWMTNDNWWKETPLYYCVIQHCCLKQ